MRYNIERDGRNKKIENDIFSKMQEIVGPEIAPEVNNSGKLLPSDNRVVTPEDAMRELLELQKKGLI